VKLWSIKINGESIKTAEDLAVKLFVEKHRTGEFLFGNLGEPLKHWIITFFPTSVSRSENGTRFALEAQALYQRTQMRVDKEYLEDVEISCEEISGHQFFDVIITFGNFEGLETEEPKEYEDAKSFLNTFFGSDEG
jgi:hypothetical protein